MRARLTSSGKCVKRASGFSAEDPQRRPFDAPPRFTLDPPPER